MKRPLRRLHLAYWLLLTPLMLVLVGYALTRPQTDTRISEDSLIRVIEGERS